MQQKTATLIGVSAIVMWASVMGLIKKVSILFGVDFGITLIYSLSAVILYPIFGFPNFKTISKKFLIITTILFVAYEIFFSYAIGLSINERQAIEVSIIHYLWPTLTVFAFIMVRELDFKPLMLLGLLVSLIGIVYMQIGPFGWDFDIILQSLYANPIPYLLALFAAIVWSVYCAVTRKYSKGNENPIAFYFFVLSIVLWIKLIFNPNAIIDYNQNLIYWLYVFVAGAGVGVGYAAWNIGVLKGNLQILVVSSYSIPILSSIFAVYILNTKLTSNFWIGATSVTIGSLICWFATRKRK